MSTNAPKPPSSRTERARNEMKKANAKNTVKKNLFAIGLVTVFALIIGGTWLSLDRSAPTYSGEVVVPENATEDFGVVYSQSDVAPVDAASNAPEPVKMTIFEDFSCPFCQAFESAIGDRLKALVAEGQLEVEYRPVAFLDDNGGSLNNYSRRSASAALCVKDAGGMDAYVAMHDALYEQQPQEGTDGPQDDDLLELAKEIEPAVSEACVTDRRYVPWVAEATQAFSDNPEVNGTPTVLIDGEIVPTEDAASALEAAVTERAVS